MKPKTFAIVAAVVVIAFIVLFSQKKTGLAPTTETNTNEQTSMPTPPANTNTNAPSESEPKAIGYTRTYLAGRYGVSANEVEILEYTAKEWPDACLGLIKTGEMCAQVITPGYEIQVRINGSTYIYRSNEKGTAIRHDASGDLVIKPSPSQIDISKLRADCKQNSDCGNGLTCVSYYGIAGPGGPSFASCEIRCMTNAECPASTQCATIADGPGQVCVKS